VRWWSVSLRPDVGMPDLEMAMGEDRDHGRTERGIHWLRILIESVAIVASILLAFAVDA